MENTMQLADHEYKDCMLDLETMGTTPGSAVVAIGAVMFDRETASIGDKFYVNLDLEQVMAAGFTATGGTLEFWLKQPDEARLQLLKDPVFLVDGVMSFAEFVTHGELGVNKDMRVWGNGAAFDNVLLRCVYERLGMLAPWNFWNDRCFRTIKNEEPRAKELLPEFVGTPHNALDDAVHQAKWAINLYHGQRMEHVEYVGHDEEESE